jgi:hypothetical protein
MTPDDEFISVYGKSGQNIDLTRLPHGGYRSMVGYFANHAWQHQQKKIDDLETQLLEQGGSILNTGKLVDRIKELEQQRDELLAAFIEYGTHPETCRKQSRNPDKCDCGYRQTINKHKAQGVQ